MQARSCTPPRVSGRAQRAAVMRRRLCSCSRALALRHLSVGELRGQKRQDDGCAHAVALLHSATCQWESSWGISDETTAVLMQSRSCTPPLVSGRAQRAAVMRRRLCSCSRALALRHLLVAELTGQQRLDDGCAHAVALLHSATCQWESSEVSCDETTAVQMQSLPCVRSVRCVKETGAAVMRRRLCSCSRA